MSPLEMRDALEPTLGRFDPIYVAAKDRHASLAAYPSLPAAIAALHRGVTPPATQAAILGAFVEELQQRPHTAWSTALLVAFAPALQRMRRQHPRLTVSELAHALLETAVRVRPDARALALRLSLETGRRALKGA